MLKFCLFFAGKKTTGYYQTYAILYVSYVLFTNNWHFPAIIIFKFKYTSLPHIHILVFNFINLI